MTNLWTLSKAQQQTFHRQGYLLLPNVLTTEQLRLLRNDCEQILDEQNELDIVADAGCVLEPMLYSHMTMLSTVQQQVCRQQATCYRQQRWRQRPAGATLVCEQLASLAAALLPSTKSTHDTLSDLDVPLYLFNEQYIVKPPRTPHTSAFVWHRDNEYMDETCQQVPTIACWIPLDDVNQENGTIRLAPYPSTTPVPPTLPFTVATYNQWHCTYAAQSSTTDYLDIVTGAGSILFMSAYLRHCSPGNQSNRTRRVYMVQYSANKVISGTTPLALAVPCYPSDTAT